MKQSAPSAQFNHHSGLRRLWRSFVALLIGCYLYVQPRQLFYVFNRPADISAKQAAWMATLGNIVTFGLLFPLARASTSRFEGILMMSVFIGILYACSNFCFVGAFTRPQKLLVDYGSGGQKKFKQNQGGGHIAWLYTLISLVSIATLCNTAGSEFMLNKTSVVGFHAETILRPLYATRYEQEFTETQKMLNESMASTQKCENVDLPNYQRMTKGTPESSQMSAVIYGRVWEPGLNLLPCEHFRQRQAIAEQSNNTIKRYLDDDRKELEQIGALEFLKKHYPKEYSQEFTENGEIANFGEAIIASFQSYFQRGITDRAVTSILTFISIVLSGVTSFIAWSMPKRHCFVRSWFVQDMQFQDIEDAVSVSDHPQS